MKVFEKPQMEVVHLMKEDIVRTSTCYGYNCDDCGDKCEGTYYCDIHQCNSSYNK